MALAVGAVLVVGGLGACWYTGNTFDRILAEQIARAQQESGIEVTWSPETENLFTRDGVLKVVVPPQTLASLIPSWREANPSRCSSRSTAACPPLYIKSHLQLDTAQGTLAPILTSLGMQQWQLGAESASSLWTMSNSSRFWVR